MSQKKFMYNSRGKDSQLEDREGYEGVTLRRISGK